MSIKTPRTNCIYEIESADPKSNSKVYLKCFKKVATEFTCIVWVVPGEIGKINEAYTSFDPTIHKIIRKIEKGEINVN